LASQVHGSDASVVMHRRSSDSANLHAYFAQKFQAIEMDRSGHYKSMQRFCVSGVLCLLFWAQLHDAAVKIVEDGLTKLWRRLGTIQYCEGEQQAG